LAVVAAVVDVNDPHQPLPAAMVARRLGVSRQLFADWVRRGKLCPYVRAPDGRPLYRYVDAVEAEQQTRRSEQANAGSFRRSPVAALS
jgi:hypothetical protein